MLFGDCLKQARDCFSHGRIRVVGQIDSRLAHSHHQRFTASWVAKSSRVGFAPAFSGQYFVIASRIVMRRQFPCDQSISVALPILSSSRPSHLSPPARSDAWVSVHDPEIIRVSLVSSSMVNSGFHRQPDPFIAEVAIDLIHAIESAHRQPLQIKFRRNAEEQSMSSVL